MAYEAIIKGGLVVDGSGRPFREANPAVDRALIAAVLATSKGGVARRDLDAGALCVAPGFLRPGRPLRRFSE